ncbi:hypothetical protein KCP76_17335 [Salmonella enterica subsp. enterica serovar Weltevreden]|nr:hypothetical protein KCP76_17335 [Salmonella enterica subsp. enterica serovar Weltevreden]
MFRVKSSITDCSDYLYRHTPAVTLCLLPTTWCSRRARGRCNAVVGRRRRGMRLTGLSNDLGVCDLCMSCRKRVAACV